MDLLPQSSISRVLLLRSLAIVVQFCAVLIGHFILDLDLALLPLLLVIALESVFQLASVWLLRKRLRQNERVGSLTIVWQLIADIGFLTLLLALSGGATNAFVSLLLLPIIIAAVTLPARLTAVITVIAIAIYTWLVVVMPQQHSVHGAGHHTMAMQGHFIAMWVNFVISALVVATVVSALARTMAKQQSAIARSREEQLRSEQLLALGNAAAQATHQLATPLATIALLHEELEELSSSQASVRPISEELKTPIEQCQAQLDLFRERSEQLRQAQKNVTASSSCTIGELVTEIKQAFSLQFPLQTLHVDTAEVLMDTRINSDPLLSAAFLNVLANAARANEHVGASNISLKVSGHTQQVQWRIEDQGQGINTQQLADLGSVIIASDNGFGVAMWLTNATIERCCGRLALTNTPAGACIDIFLPKA